MLLLSERFGGMEERIEGWMTDQKTYLSIQRDVKRFQRSRVRSAGVGCTEADGYTWVLMLTANEDNKPDRETEAP